MPLVFCLRLLIWILFRAYEQKIADLEKNLSSAPDTARQPQGPGFQSMIDSALQAANQRIASLRRAHQILLAKYTDLEIRYIELQASNEIHQLPGHPSQNNHGMDGGYPPQHGDMSPSQEYHRHGHVHQIQQQYPSELAATEPVSPTNTEHHKTNPNSYFQQSHHPKPPSRTTSVMALTGMGQNMSPPMQSAPMPSSPYTSYNHYIANNPPPAMPLPPVPGTLSPMQMSPGAMSPYPGHMSPFPGQYRDDRPSVGSIPSSAGSNGQHSSLQSHMEMAEDRKSIKTVGGSSQSSGDSKREKVKANSEVRMRGRGM